MSTEPYGSWASPITVEHLTSASVGLAAVRIDGDQLYWLESRADQGGRSSLWRRAVAGGEPTEVTPAPATSGTGCTSTAAASIDVDDGVVVFSDFTDGRVYRLRDGAPAVPITPAGALSLRRSAAASRSSTWCWPSARTTADGEPVNTIVALDLDGGRTPTAGSCSARARTSTPPPSCPAATGWPGPSGTTRTCRGIRP